MDTFEIKRARAQRRMMTAPSEGGLFSNLLDELTHQINQLNDAYSQACGEGSLAVCDEVYELAACRIISEYNKHGCSITGTKKTANDLNASFNLVTDRRRVAHDLVNKKEANSVVSILTEAA